MIVSGHPKLTMLFFAYFLSVFLWEIDSLTFKFLMSLQCWKQIYPVVKDQNFKIWYALLSTWSTGTWMLTSMAGKRVATIHVFIVHWGGHIFFLYIHVHVLI